MLKFLLEFRLVALVLLVLSAMACSADDGTGHRFVPDDPDVLLDVVEDVASDTAGDPSDGTAEPDVDIGEDGQPADAADSDVPSGPTPPARPEIGASRLEQLQTQLSDIFDDASMEGSQLTALVVEEETGRVLYESDPDLALAPASNTKLFTTAAALAQLGEDYRFQTRVFADQAANELGVIDGDLYLVGAHDFTFSAHFYEAADFPFERIADELYQMGIREVTGTVWAYGELVYGGYRYDAFDPDAHRAAAVDAFRAALLDAGISVDGVATDSAFEPPEGSLLLTDWWSIPLSVGCSRINTISHNEFADALMRHLGFVFRGQSTYADGAQVVLDWLDSEGVDTEGLSLNDGSGLSHDNRVSARHVLSLLRLMLSEPIGVVWERGFTIAGIRGTLASRLTGADTLGRVFGKTGTLSISIALSGILVNRHDGRRYLFSFIINDQSDNSSARAVLDAAVEALAVDLLGTGTRPGMPELDWVANDGNNRTATAQWEAVSGAEGYWVWSSVDGYVFRRSDAEYTEDTMHILDDRAAGERLFVRVTAVNAAGESDASNVYATRIDTGSSPLLIVDGQERWLEQPVAENTLSAAHDFVVDYAVAVDELTIDSASNAAITRGDLTLDDYSAVVLSLGEESVEHESFDATEQALVNAYTAQGGNLFVTGAEIGWDLVAEGSVDDAAFFEGTLRSAYLGDDAGTYLVEGSGGLFNDINLISFYTPDETVVSFPDQLAPNNGSVEVLRYVGGQGGIAGVQYNGPYRLVLLGFPFESIDNAGDRADVMARVVAFFGM